MFRFSLLTVARENMICIKYIVESYTLNLYPCKYCEGI